MLLKEIGSKNFDLAKTFSYQLAKLAKGNFVLEEA